ncbi:deoxyribodipyrimidine photo-lyase [Pseudonocardia sp. KRD-184]|uniref:Deoxyribodipyrimidine photo-lyase n=1 Tax=Pseudonocardia oceani TaxID=2792013 RepID=A0ABS6UB02_9PSEU|nr:deoxyribodipyrimidine photo-lyase [Pseudonocardia oceani]MBW0092939.1 deoxyribodipyrimidine photo-lyase [Pseudonocardia oceani]MBW0097413.1 deoxyribodipyrimidine photo-lyase [Pseudonocardia oceani]MBW0112370.1 deoxyribodipyrimidine photo-lyase [Pseudonocardia oceani]MBW0124150.1 deoxyribodipyrimidine photo-lyase [Pseudonocardia oceani]MBW0129405.1 deoxyribodipyrimidine photo-lyase [Pseudonocardia oceani]
MTDASVVWFRRDLRVRDQPTFLAAADAAPRALALFVLDPALLGPSGAPRRTFLFRALRSLDESLGGRLLVVEGDPVDVVPRAAAAVGAATVHVAADFGPYGTRRDETVEQALADDGRVLVRTGSPYAVAPGRVRKADGEPFRVFTPFRRVWADHGWRPPADTDASTVTWMDPADKDGGPRAVRIPDDDPMDAELPEASEDAALARWREFLDDVDDYAAARDRPDKPGTSRMSVYLKYGLVHPRTQLADLARRRSDSVETYRTEIAWREFYADVLFQRPDSARGNYDRSFDALPLASGAAARVAFDRWAEGRTGFPIVDAGMRQLCEQAWVHNRVRMIVASFLVKDLHLPWWLGARHFMRYLVDGDLASNQHGWQWTAGSGTDASPYFRVFNPITQGEKFDPEGDYVRTFVPELRGVPGKAVHQPWALPGGVPEGYPEPMVDHKAERLEALARYDRVKEARR